MAHADSPDDTAATGKILVRRLIDDVMNAGRLDVLEELYTPESAVAARRWIEPFRRLPQRLVPSGIGDRDAAAFHRGD